VNPVAQKLSAVVEGCAMAEAVSCCLFTVEASVHALVSPCGICGGQFGTGQAFLLSSCVFPCQYHYTMAFHAHLPRGV
jgi:hypothetical protein